MSAGCEPAVRHRFVFIRHAEARCNLQSADARIDSVSPDSPLTATGEEQARLLAAGLPEELVGARVFCSPMRRAVLTAGAIADRHGVPLAVDGRLEELRIASPLRPALDVAAWDSMLERRLAHPRREALPGVETLLAQRERVADFLLDRHAGRGRELSTLVVSHAFTIELAINLLLGQTPRMLARWRLRISNAALHVIENDYVGGPSRLMLVNAKNHLGTLL
ncbi:histidine phosphatase family protein [Paludibacterium paludis]|uniref:Phosphoglycerate mutase n=1 Tax=Paludibacterium paludis TaxID=1225769 RepID=A0A918P686_9NEIS|nr:histidine phosphatase family protein [Paludibacterium paludis]GGY24669.1 hypothetical protein GCM10011289_30360 [Paludibacterium paludis]